MAGLRDVLIHDYDEIDLEMIWKIITEDLIQVKAAIDQLEIDN